MTLNEKHSIYLISRTPPLCVLMFATLHYSRTRCLVLRGNTGDVATTFNQGSGRRAGLGCMNFSKYSSTTTTTRVYCRFSPSITGPFYQSAWDYEWWYTVLVRQLAGTVQLFYCRYAGDRVETSCVRSSSVPTWWSEPLYGYSELWDFVSDGRVQIDRVCCMNQNSLSVLPVSATSCAG